MLLIVCTENDSQCGGVSVLFQVGDARSLDREEVETGLSFAGFAVCLSLRDSVCLFALLCARSSLLALTSDGTL